MNSKADELVRTLARLAAKSSTGRLVAPVPCTSRQSAEAVILSQFRLAFGVAVAKANARLKLERLYFAGSSRDLAHQQIDDFHRTRQETIAGSADCPRWFRLHHPDGNYKAWFDFRKTQHEYKSDARSVRFASGSQLVRARYVPTANVAGPNHSSRTRTVCS